MKTRRLLTGSALLLLLPLASYARADLDAVRVGEAAYRLVVNVDEDGDVRVSLMVPVENLGFEIASISVEIRALDSDGFELFDDTLYADVPPGESVRLSDWQWVAEKAFRSIDRLETEVDGGYMPFRLETEDPIRCGEIETRVTDPEFSETEVKYAIKAEVENSGDEDRHVSIRLAGYDADGFRVEDISLDATLAAGETRTLTESQVLEKQAFESISEWRVPELD